MKDILLNKNFIELIENNQGILHKVSNLYCDDTDERKDLVQDILVQLWTAFPRFRGDSKVSSWIYRIALNTAITRIRKVSKNVYVKTDVSELFSLPDKDEYAEKEEKQLLVQKALSKLEKTEKAIIILYIDDYPYDEIAQIIGITVSNVGVKINRIKKKLKTIIEELQNGI